MTAPRGLLKQTTRLQRLLVARVVAHFRQVREGAFQLRHRLLGRVGARQRHTCSAAPWIKCSLGGSHAFMLPLETYSTSVLRCVHALLGNCTCRSQGTLEEEPSVHGAVC
jgi:hypothetical protein